MKRSIVQSKQCCGWLDDGVRYVRILVMNIHT